MRVVLKVLSLQCLWLVSSILSKSIVGLMRHVDQKTQRWWFSSGINKATFSTYICLSFISCIYLIWIGFSVRNTVIQDKYRFFPTIDKSGNHQFIKQTVYKHIFRWSSNYDTSQRTHAHFLSPIHKLAISNLKLIRELKNCFEEKKTWSLKRAQSPLLEDANYDLERNDSKNILSRCRLNLRDISTNYTSNYSIRSRLSTYQVYLKCYFKNPCFQQ